MAYKVNVRRYGYSSKGADARRLRSAAYRYAQHMGVKYGLSSYEVSRNASEHYSRAMRDLKFRNMLFDQYG